MNRNERKQAEKYDQNNCCTIFVIVVNLFAGLGLPALEVAQLLFVWNLDHLKYRNEQYSLFGEACPGIWLGALFLATAISGIVARQTRQNPVRRHVRFTVFASLNLTNTMACILMLGVNGYTMDRMQFDYPKLCKSFPYMGTYDHICDYENGFYTLVGLLVGMIVLYCLEGVVSILGAIYSYRKVCTCQKYELLEKSAI